jgi:hypothetical protein
MLPGMAPHTAPDKIENQRKAENIQRQDEYEYEYPLGQFNDFLKYHILVRIPTGGNVRPEVLRV